MPNWTVVLEVQSLSGLRKWIMAAFAGCLLIASTEPATAQDRAATIDELSWKNGTSVLTNGHSKLVLTNANLVVDGSITANNYFGDLPHAVVILRSDGTTDQYPFSADTDVARGDALELAWAALTDDSTVLIPGYQGQRYRVDAHWSSIHCAGCPDLNLGLHSTNLSRVAVIGIGMPDITVGDGITADRGCHVTLDNCYDWLFMNMTFSAYPKPEVLDATETLYSVIQPNNEGVEGKGHTYINLRCINYGNHGPGVSSWNWHNTWKLTNNWYQAIYGENGGDLAIEGKGTADGVLIVPMSGDTVLDIWTENCARTIEFGGGENQTMGNVLVDGVKVNGSSDSAIMMFGSAAGFVDWNDVSIRNVVITGSTGIHQIQFQGFAGNRLARWTLENISVLDCSGQFMMFLRVHTVDGFAVRGYHVYNDGLGGRGFGVIEGAGGLTGVAIRDSSIRGVRKEALILDGEDVRVVNVTAIDNSRSGDFPALRVLGGSDNVQFHHCRVVNYLSSSTHNDGLIIDAGALNTLINDVTYQNIETGGNNLIDNGTGTIVGRWADTDDGLFGLGDYVEFNGLAVAPAGSEGQVYYDSVTKKFRGHDGTSWVDLH